MRDHHHFVFLNHHRRMIMDDMVNAHRRVPDSTPPPASAAAGKSPLGFPLGTALILFIVFGVSTLFSCCYHWEKIRSHTNRFTARSSSSRSNAASDSSSSAAATTTGNAAAAAAAPGNEGQQQPEKSKCSKQAYSLPVMMPGDEIPKYVAWPSPHGLMDECGATGCHSQNTSPPSKAAVNQSAA